MSRLEKNGHSITKERQQKFYHWRKDEPLLVEHPVRWAATQAMRDEDTGAVNHLLSKKYKRRMERMNKPQINQFLANVLRGYRIA